MKKKVLAVLMTGVIGMGLLAGCGNGSSEEKKGNSGNGDEKVEITFWDNYADTIHTQCH